MDTTKIAESKAPSTKERQPLWLIYLSLLVAGGFLVGQAYEIGQLQKWTARVGLALIISVGALIVGNGRWAGYFAAAIIWIAVIVVYFV